MQMRRHVKQETSLRDRLSAFAAAMREKAADLAPGLERDELLSRARQADTAQHMGDWVSPPGLRSPR
jgi:hypothetical protein